MVDSVKKILIESRSAEYFQNQIWQPAEEMAEKAGIDLTLPITGWKQDCKVGLKMAIVYRREGQRKCVYHY